MSIKTKNVNAATLYLVATPIGNLADMSSRALDILQQVSVVAAEDTRHTRKLLSFFGIENALLSLHEHNEVDKSASLLARLQNGESIALVSDAGTPLISDPGYPLVSLCRQHGITVVPVPGPSAIISALSASGLPTDNFRFCGFPPRQSSKRQTFFQQFRQETATLVFYESSHRIIDCLKDINEVFGRCRSMCIARELTKLYETFIFGSSAEVLGKLQQDPNQQRGEFVVMISGAEKTDEQQTLLDADTLLSLLSEELPIKKAAALAAKLTGQKKNALYQRALQLKDN